jgi:hypothetical protein
MMVLLLALLFLWLFVLGMFRLFTSRWDFTAISMFRFFTSRWDFTAISMFRFFTSRWDFTAIRMFRFFTSRWSFTAIRMFRFFTSRWDFTAIRMFRFFTSRWDFTAIAWNMGSRVSGLSRGSCDVWVRRFGGLRSNSGGYGTSGGSDNYGRGVHSRSRSGYWDIWIDFGSFSHTTSRSSRSY